MEIETGTVMGGIRPTQLRGEARQAGLFQAQMWRQRMKPMFDAMDAEGAFWDSPVRHPQLRSRAAA